MLAQGRVAERLQIGIQGAAQRFTGRLQELAGEVWGKLRCFVLHRAEVFIQHLKREGVEPLAFRFALQFAQQGTGATSHDRGAGVRGT